MDDGAPSLPPLPPAAWQRGKTRPIIALVVIGALSLATLWWLRSGRATDAEQGSGLIAHEFAGLRVSLPAGGLEVVTDAFEKGFVLLDIGEDQGGVVLRWGLGEPPDFADEVVEMEARSTRRETLTSRFISRSVKR